MPRVLISVYDKTGIVAFAKDLVSLGWEVVASDGSRRELAESGLPVTPISQLTGMPEILNGRVKSLHSAIYAGILATDKVEDIETLQRYGYAPINMVICNLYPFSETVTATDITVQDAVELIDIGGVTLLRAAAKNFLYTSVISAYNDYAKVSKVLKALGEVDIALRRELAAKAFAYTRDYDTAIHAFLAQDAMPHVPNNSMPKFISIGLSRVESMRYGENPHQTAAYYTQDGLSGLLGGKLLNGKHLSYNNILDLDAAWRVVSSFSDPTVCIIKHLTPTGIASATSVDKALPNAIASDPLSAYGGIVASNRKIDTAFVNALGTLFVEALVAPQLSLTAQSALSEKRKNCRLVQISRPYQAGGVEIRSVHSGLLIQQVDDGDPEGTTFTTVTARNPTQEEFDCLRFAWKTVQHVKSNAIVLAVNKMTVGIGGGLPSRVDATKLALSKAGDRAVGAVMASDAFFPFGDSIDAAAQAGVTAVIQPGGSIRDQEVIDAANRANMSMIFTGTRHFRH